MQRRNFIQNALVAVVGVCLPWRAKASPSVPLPFPGPNPLTAEQMNDPWLFDLLNGVGVEDAYGLGYGLHNIRASVKSAARGSIVDHMLDRRLLSRFEKYVPQFPVAYVISDPLLDGKPNPESKYVHVHLQPWNKELQSG